MNNSDDGIYKQLVNNIVDYAIYLLDPEGHVMNWNTGACRIKGYTPEDIIGRHFSIFYSEQDRKRNQPHENLVHARRHGRFEEEGWRLRHDGEPFCASVVIDAVYDDNGLLIGFAKITRDITERRHRERALALAHEDTARRNLELAELSTFLQAVITNIPMHVLVQSLATGDIVLDSMQGHRVEDDTLPSVGELIMRLAPQARRVADIGASEETLLLHHGAHGVQHLKCKVLSIHQEADDSDYLLYLIENVTEIHEHQANINFMAHHDVLTGLPNRARFLHYLDEALKPGSLRQMPTGVLMVDLDNFKDINDVLGHHIGDAVLAELASSLSSALTPHEILARLGGDEFALIVPNCRCMGDLVKRAETLLAECQRGIEIDHHSLQIGLSIGVAITSELIDTSEELMKAADMAMYEAKRGGRGRWACFTPELHDAACERLGMETELRQALMREELVLYYQPVMQAGNHAASGQEALLRWRHPERGMVSPMEFIPVAERIGAIHDIGEWVLQEACREAATWPGHLTVAVNLSPVQFERSTLVEQVRKALALSGLEPSRLELEITESILLDTSQRNIHTLRALKDLGVSIALDDFGTGYSSLHYLRSFAFDRIKIDRSFVNEICSSQQARAIIKAIASLGASLGIKITAEGVEDLEQAGVLEREGCSHLQGFYFGRPVDPMSMQPSCR
ncbi:sensor domain-containing protein [Larsenimonas rhizosphaerae]|uniref:EAL domain-containing protein n=1 Tax=Larsenimonas rhizosphaerae TaxID=2944682 RepID=A0AA42CXT2_9GAMM|nr:EAL domain-containing protein [Larsenimonas rhizosphaerae]MCX2524240.1 EAL domain-containing protein [Larsenimonas rhizosphaerae]